MKTVADLDTPTQQLNRLNGFLIRTLPEFTTDILLKMIKHRGLKGACLKLMHSTLPKCIANTEYRISIITSSSAFANTMLIDLQDMQSALTALRKHFGIRNNNGHY